ncbi:MAG: ATP-dependent protease ATPase subunit HslU [Gammaproteobacteria bacterium]
MNAKTQPEEKFPTPEELTPRRIVRELDRYIVGQAAAKRSVALALRSRWRRMQVEPPLRDDIAPKNILMIGPTGVGKTEISRRLARLTGAPFIKVEATKFTEVGYVGRDVDSIIRDLLEMAVESVRADCAEEVRERAEKRAEERILAALLPGEETTAATREKILAKLRAGDLDEKEIDIEISAVQMMEMQMPPGMEEMAAQLQTMLQSAGRERRKMRRMTVGTAFDMLADEETDNLVDMNEVKDMAIDGVENNGIVFIDEIDKIAGGGRDSERDISRHGVQRDLLPLVEGTTVSTRFGNVHTDHILFVASGSFHYASPADLIPELQGRFPLRVELSPLGVADFCRILSDTDSCLARQYEALFKTEAVKLRFTPEGVSRIAEIAWEVNENSENIGARRLYTMLENLLEEASFNADQMGGKTIVIDEKMVEDRLAAAAGDRKRARYVL